MATYNTPGVYVEEVSNLAPSVVQVATAVPAFIGYTEKGFTGPNPSIARINTLLDYTNLFGLANPSAFSVDGDLNVTRSDAASNNFLMYYAVQMYFLNGGSTCYIISIGGYTTTTADGKPTTTVPAKADFEAGLLLLAKQDEPTLVVLPDAVNLPQPDYYALAQDTLAHCATLADRFAILDVAPGDIANFRNNIGINNLCYGAAYYPYLKTSLNYQYLETGVKVTNGWSWSSDPNGITVSNLVDGTASVSFVVGTGSAVSFDTTTTPGTLAITLPASTTTAAVATAWSTWTGASNNFNVIANGNGSSVLSTIASTSLQVNQQALSDIKSTNTSLYNQVKVLLAAENVIMPPSSSLAGVYVAVDGSRGFGRHRPMSAWLRWSPPWCRSAIWIKPTSMLIRRAENPSTPSAPSPARVPWFGGRAPWQAMTTIGAIYRCAVCSSPSKNPAKKPPALQCSSPMTQSLG